MNSIQNYGMMNCQQSAYKKNNVSFGARFRSEDIEKLIDGAMHEKECGRFPELPQLYTYLERLDEIKNGSVAELKLGEKYCGFTGCPQKNPKIEIDGKEFYENIGGNRGNYWLDTLKSAIMDGTIDSLKMPESIHEQKVWEHRNVTADDIRKFTYDA